MRTLAICTALEHMQAIDTGDEAPLARAAWDEVTFIRHAARVLTNPMDYTTDEYMKASALLKALAEDVT